jgi:hypothetical protein
LIVLLAIYFLLDILAVIFTGQYLWIARTAILAIAAWRTLQGSRAASRFLGCLFVLNAVVAATDGISLRNGDPVDAIGTLIFAAFIAVIAAYVFFSPSMRLLYVQGDKTRWRPR